jgi:DNA transformation protein and related proteins
VPPDTAYLDFLLDWLSPLGEIMARPMFGGHCLYCDGIVFALTARNTLYLKVDEQTRPRFEALGLKAFQPFEDRPGVMQYYQPPPDFFENADAMSDWAGAAFETGKRARVRKKKPRAAARVSKRKR